jgi:polyhydroxybutyrate depolymerase
MAISGMNAVANTGRFLVAYPNATVEPRIGLPQWNEGSMYPNGPDDVGFIGAMVDEIEDGYEVDPARIYATGFSLGGIMSYYLGSQLSDRLAAVASVGGQHPLNPTAPRPLPMLHMHGTADPIVPFAGGFANVPAPLNLVNLPPVMDVVAAWRDGNGCVGEPVVTQLPNVNAQDGSTIERSHYEDCECYLTASGEMRPAEVLYYRIAGGGHTWPGVGPAGFGNVNRDINASEEIWKFFSRHELPAVNAASFPGDYNQNGTVDAADYVVWRKELGTTYAQADYDTWRSHFGQMSGNGTVLPSAELLPAAIPEPVTLVLATAGLFAVTFFHRKRTPERHLAAC